MKNYIIMALAAFSLLFAACKEKEEIAQFEIVSADNLFISEGGEGNIVFESSSEVTGIQCPAEWLTATLRQSDVLLVVSENTDLVSRTTTVTLTNKAGATQAVEITQKGAKVSFNAADVEFPAISSDVTLSYQAENKIVIRIPDDAKEWLKAYTAISTFTLVASRNNTIENRSTTVKYALGSKSGSFKVTQKGADVYLDRFDPKDIDAPKEGKTYAYSFSTNSTFTAKSTASWITTSIENEQLKVTVAQNFLDEPREGEVQWSVAKSDLKGSIKIKQEKGVVVRVLTLKNEDGALSEINAGYMGGKQNITVNTNTTWTATTDASWIKISPASNSEKSIEPKDQAVEIEIEAVEDGAAREATVTFDGTDVENGPVKLKIAQAGFNKISISVSNITYNSIKATFTPSNDDPYLYGLFEKNESNTDEVMFNIIKKEIEDLVKEYEGTYTKEQILSMVCPTTTYSTTMGDLDPETEYTVVAFAIDGDINITSPVFKFDTKTAEDPWKYLGVGKYTDGFVSGFFSLDPKTAPVEVYESKQKPGYYAIKNPYGPKMLANWWYNATEQQLEAYEGQLWKSVMFEIDATNASRVIIIMQETGFYSSNYGFQTGGNAYYSNNKLYVYSNCVGTLANGKITFQERGLRQTFEKLDSMYYANINTSFCVEIPSSSSTSAAPQSVKKEKRMNDFEKALIRESQPVTSYGWSMIARPVSE